mmetsp:Transcript_31248/g.47263  ORF Transcript_31248/g.47263 Transcript_31248/m.47263 type:complete len:130 (+) Transcript_31248:111-500(+)|eukprot:CAMPEP_0178926256 /NCGR_PEP_ID=MMETSP0786-20121207/18421_1 /TAXON_ID=186022 /ORGANISM="Thalassionema frauenfeldii, Strain CCMP 1798" /LENGTH=129 /DNA_ID=CAMNT_0020601337 /DNA_START=88 /DNA_END=477 /DNA_ORIENTATION=+
MKRFTLVLLALVLASSSAFTAPVTKRSRIMENSLSTTTELAERRWNFNDQFQGPFGLKKNAEIWNGRVAQMAFVTIFIQELVQGKGVIQGVQDGDIVNYISLGFAAVCTLGLTAFLAIKGETDLIEPEL